VADRTLGLCILCHAAPLPAVRFMGNLGPDLAGVGDRLTMPELRERIVDSRRINPDTIMPPYHSLANLRRVGERWQGTTILTAQEIEDVVAYLATLTNDGGTE
jgi:sulfur-oxidizing protein SoxX